MDLFMHTTWVEYITYRILTYAIWLTLECQVNAMLGYLLSPLSTYIRPLNPFILKPEEQPIKGILQPSCGRNYRQHTAQLSQRNKLQSAPQYCNMLTSSDEYQCQVHLELLLHYFIHMNPFIKLPPLLYIPGNSIYRKSSSIPVVFDYQRRIFSYNNY